MRPTRVRADTPWAVPLAQVSLAFPACNFVASLVHHRRREQATA